MRLGTVLLRDSKTAEEGEKLFDDDIVTDYPRKLAIADTIREKYLAKMHQEVPHEMGILVKKIREQVMGIQNKSVMYTL